MPVARFSFSRVLIWCAVGAFGVALGLFLAHQFFENPGGGIEVHWFRRFRASGQRGSSASECEGDQEQIALGFYGGLVNFVR